MIIAAAYVRVSTDEQTDYSPAAQLADIKEYATQNGYHIPEEFIFMDKEIIKEEKDNGKTILISSHEREIIEDLCDEVYFMKDGELTNNQ